ncbi:DUF4810 domain-containing protein [Nitrospina gracilis]|nr:DUF4810 domain-containing protein [Nitrospina gracilis]
MIFKSTSPILFILSLLFISSCAQTHYSWNGYDQALYDHYQSPGERAQYVETLKVIVQKAEESGKIPPGLYAEYGYTFYEVGSYQQAVLYFQREASLWPESRYFMNKMIRNAETQGKRSHGDTSTSKQKIGGE